MPKYYCCWCVYLLKKLNLGMVKPEYGMLFGPQYCINYNDIDMS